MEYQKIVNTIGILYKKYRDYGAYTIQLVSDKEIRWHFLSFSLLLTMQLEQKVTTRRNSHLLLKEEAIRDATQVLHRAEEAV